MKRTLILECLETKALMGALSGAGLALTVTLSPAMRTLPPPHPEPDPGPLPIDDPPIVLPPIPPSGPVGPG
jgi:hypothetical protein